MEGDIIFNVLKIADAERVEGTERPVYPVKVTSCEVGELGPLAGKLKDRKSVSSMGATNDKPVLKKKKKAAKAGNTLLSFGGDEGDEEMPIRPAKPKFNTTLVAEVPGAEEGIVKEPENGISEPKQPRKRPRSPSLKPSPSIERQKRPKSPDPQTQLPLQNPESPERSPTPKSPPKKESKLSRTNAEIASLKASMRRNVDSGPVDRGRKRNALEAMIPETSIRGRRRPIPGSANGAGSNMGPRSAAEREALRLFNAFKAKLDNADAQPSILASHHGARGDKAKDGGREAAVEDEEAQLCDLHFIANCQSCQSWDNPEDASADEGAGTESGWLTHVLRFGKDNLGKDLQWKKDHRDDIDSRMVIDPREKEKELTGNGGRKRGLQRDRERERKLERAGDLEWHRERQR